MNTDIIITNPIFNTLEDLKEYLIEHELEDTAFFEHPSYVKAITGITSCGQLIYDYDLMIAAAMEEEGWDYDDAIDWIDYNVVPTAGGLLHPIVSHHIVW